jgi:superfamily I DNA/RNA helicase
METWWRELGDLDEDQREVIALPAEGSFLIKGPPGSGKTNLLLLRANYLMNTEHSNLVIIVFNRTLRDFICSGSGSYDFEAENVLTSRQFLDQLLDEAGAPYEAQGEFNEDRLGRLAAAEAALANLREPIYDVILLDEAQDYLPGEIRLFRRLGRDIFMVADSRQQIYRGDERIIRCLESAVDETRSLRFHYRSGQPICQVADGIGATFSIGYEPILPTCNYNAVALPPSVDVFQGGTEAQAAEIAGRLVLQRRTYPEGLLGVICPRLSELRIIADALEERGFGPHLCVQDREDGYQPILADRLIWLSTVHGAKGLEFRALHFAAAEFVTRFGAQRKRLAYTAVTRAKTSLWIYHHDRLPPWFDAALNPSRPPRQGPNDLGAAFGRR